MQNRNDTILIADDFSSMRKVIRRACGEENHRFIEATNGIEAIKAYTFHLPTWVIMGATIVFGLYTDLPLHSARLAAQFLIGGGG